MGIWSRLVAASSNKPPCRSVVFAEEAQKKLKAPDLSPAVAPKGFLFYVEPVRRWHNPTPTAPSEYSVRVYLLSESQAETVRTLTVSRTSFYKEYGYPCFARYDAYWIDNDPEETKKWINSTMHELLKLKRKKDEEKARLDSLTGFYPPKEM